MDNETQHKLAEIRAQATATAIDINQWSFELASTAPSLEGAFELLHRAYVGRGIQRDKKRGLRITPQHLFAESLVFVARDADDVVGTITATKDSPAGLPLDKDYPEELTTLRTGGAALVELGSLAVRPDHRHSRLAMLLGMLAISAGMNLLSSTHVVIGVHPNAEDHHRAIFDFARLGPPRKHSELAAAVVGMVQRTTGIVERFFAPNFPRPLADGRPTSSLVDPWPCFRDEHARRLSRHAFQRIFADHSDALEGLDAGTLEYLQTQRSPETLRAGA